MGGVRGKPVVIEGFRSGMLVVTKKISAKRVMVKCDCGTEKEVYNHSLTSSHRATSCGCLKLALFKTSNTTHGLSKKPEYFIWTSMRQRCGNPKNPGYPDYGARGIKVDPSWESFEQFYKDMGDKPKCHSLDRIDPNGPYSKQNCVWASTKTQANNKRPRVRHRNAHLVGVDTSVLLSFGA
jgi:hypothetical protein